VAAGGSGSCASPPHGSATPQVSLDVTIYAATDPAADVAPTHYTLTCEPDGGTVPDPAVACAQLLADTDLFAPQPAGVMCPMIMVDAARFVISGTYLGEQVNETIADGGCDLQRWSELRQIFPVSDVQPVNPGGPVVPGQG
jgi:Subtilisin inhibitor-like